MFPEDSKTENGGNSMNELMQPLDRELMRPRMQRSDGFSNDGLSYSVANDFGKLWGQALADYEARTAQPRSDVYGKTLRDDTPEVLRSELLDPIIQRFSATTPRTSHAAPRTYKFGNQLLSVDPLSGATKNLFTAPEKPDTRGDSFEKSLILGKINQLRHLQSDPLKLYSSGLSNDEIESQINDLAKQGRGIYNKPGSPALAPKQTRGKLSEDGAREYMKKARAAGGGRDEAEKMALDDGFEL